MQAIFKSLGLFLAGAFLAFFILTLINHGSSGEFSPFRYMLF